MKICVYGAGAIGGYLAGRLAEGGAEVSAVARGPHLAAIRAEGLTVRTPGGALRGRFAPDAAAMPGVTVSQPPLGAYEEIATVRRGGAA